MGSKISIGISIEIDEVNEQVTISERGRFDGDECLDKEIKLSFDEVNFLQTWLNNHLTNVSR